MNKRNFFKILFYLKVDKEEIHHKIFKSYLDPVSLGPYNDHPDAIGTEMRQYPLYDELISSPTKMKETFLNERLRRLFLFDANIKKASFEMLQERPEIDDDGLPVLLPEISGRRRVDRKL